MPPHRDKEPKKATHAASVLRKKGEPVRRILLTGSPFECVSSLPSIAPR